MPAGSFEPVDGPGKLECTVEGERLISSARRQSSPPYITTPGVTGWLLDRAQGNWDIRAQDGKNGDYLYLNLRRITGPGTYGFTSEDVLRDDTTRAGATVLLVRNRDDSGFESDSLRTGTLVITRLDTSLHVIQGTFYCDLIGGPPAGNGAPPRPRHTIQVRDGWFYVKY